MTDLIRLRQRLHSHAEPSGQEQNTSRLIRDVLMECRPDALIEGLGGYGMAAVFNGATPGPRILLRCELDGLPIQESINVPYASNSPGVAHKCGHDGHMAIIAGVAEGLKSRRPSRGSVALLYQPAEENGSGAAAVIADPRFPSITPDFAFALHNLPGFPLGSVIIRKHVFALASIGIRIFLHGRTSHAAEPERGMSPASAVAQLIIGLSGLPQSVIPLHQAAKVTVVYARLGEIAFGTSPGEGSVMATIRSYSQDTLDMLIEQAAQLGNKLADAYGLSMTQNTVDPFPPTVNDPAAVSIVEASAADLDVPLVRPPNPFGWSEDFGHFASLCPSALFGLGAGEDHPALHNPDYDFPDSLLQPGIDIFEKIILRVLD